MMGDQGRMGSSLLNPGAVIGRSAGRQVLIQHDRLPTFFVEMANLMMTYFGKSPRESSPWLTPRQDGLSRSRTAPSSVRAWMESIERGYESTRTLCLVASTMMGLLKTTSAFSIQT